MMVNCSLNQMVERIVHQARRCSGARAGQEVPQSVAREKDGPENSSPAPRPRGLSRCRLNVLDQILHGFFQLRVVESSRGDAIRHAVVQEIDVVPVRRHDCGASSFGSRSRCCSSARLRSRDGTTIAVKLRTGLSSADVSRRVSRPADWFGRHGDPNQVVSASTRPRCVPSPTQAT
jgi:hypothetical protein